MFSSAAHRPLWLSPYLLLTLTVLFWSGNWVIGRAAVGSVPPVALAFWRWSLAVLFMLPLALPQMRRDWPRIRAHWKVIVGLAVLGMGYHNVFSYLGLQYTTATNGVMFNSSIPIFIIALGWLFFGQRITRLQLLGVGISLTGVVAILARGELAVLANLKLNPGDLILLGAMMQWALYTLALKWRPEGISALAFLCTCAIIGVIAMMPAYAIEIAVGKSIRWSWPVAGALVYVGLFPSFLGYIFWNRGVHDVGPSVAGMFVHLMPVFGSLLAWLFLDERLYWFHLLGLVLILSGIVLTTRNGVPIQAAPAD
jgi:drug/metabolite transporter (DMT)-like permease